MRLIRHGFATPRRDTAAAARRVACLALAVFGLVACARIEIREADGQLKIERHFGVISIRLEPGTAAQVVESNGIGVMSDGRALVVGYFDSHLALLGSDCRVVLWIEEREHLVTAHELFGGDTEVCAIAARTMEAAE